MTLKDAIKVRRSVRSYAKREIEPEKLEALRASLATLPSLWGGAQGEMVKVGLLSLRPGDKTRLGTYGVISGARTFMGLFIRRDDARHRLAAGYAFEHAVLTATTLGLATCWLGGTFSRDRFTAAFGSLDRDLEGWSLLCVSPVGYDSGKRGIVDAVFRRTAGSDSRHPFEQLFFLQNFQDPYPAEGAPLSEAFADVRLAPSACNRQPWRVLAVNPGWIHFFGAKDPDYLEIDMGIAMAHFDIALERREPRWVIQPDFPYTPPTGLTYIATTAVGD